ncbi:30S ribosomal protein S16 [Candidatus Ishikawella capsulata]|nr:30S ribosomal protein S16 [Candidatus Ishikawaella capsulata]
MVKIRLAYHGAKKRPFFQIVVTDCRKARNGKFIERIGFFNPISSGRSIPMRLDLNRIAYWISKGAQLSNRVQSLIKKYQND